MNKLTFSEFCAALGIHISHDIPLGKWVDAATDSHPRKKKGRVKLLDDGKIGFAIDYITMTECAVWRADIGTTPKERTAKDNEELTKRLALRAAEEKAGTMRARAAYAKAAPLTGGNHEYIRKKRISMAGCLGLRIDADGCLLVPMMRDGVMISVQRISPEGEKRFAAGAPVKWGKCIIKRPGAAMTILAEGLATALTVFEAVEVANVIVCFSASNMAAVAEREAWSGMMAVAGDNDHWTREMHGKNPGEEAAQRAATIIGCGYALPYCEGTDFNDLFCERLAKMEDEAGGQSHRSPRSLRLGALAPVKLALMNAAKIVDRK